MWLSMNKAHETPEENMESSDHFVPLIKSGKQDGQVS